MKSLQIGSLSRGVALALALNIGEGDDLIIFLVAPVVLLDPFCCCSCDNCGGDSDVEPASLMGLLGVRDRAAALPAAGDRELAPVDYGSSSPG